MGSPCPPYTSVGENDLNRARLTRYSARDGKRREGSTGSGDNTGFGVMRFNTQSPAITVRSASRRNEHDPGVCPGVCRMRRLPDSHSSSASSQSDVYSLSPSESEYLRMYS